MEQAKGHFANNVVTVLMQDNNIDLQAASDLIGMHFVQLVDQFQSAQLHVPSFGAEVDVMVSKYMEGLAYWVSGNLKYVTLLCLLTCRELIFLFQAGALKDIAIWAPKALKSRRLD